MANSKLYTCDTPDPALCWSTPPEFVRLRYFYGQRLGVVELSDEQAYLIGKQWLHNLRAHGVGVLCGLRAERFIFPAGAPPTTPTRVLLVRRGLALDGCGREIVVGWDQCIDVGAWFAKNLPLKEELEQWFDPNFDPAERALFLAVCYRECPSDPEPAPRDPCGCDRAGCEHGRVREGFELKLLTASEAAECAKRVFSGAPSPFHPEEALNEPFDAALARFLNTLTASDCPDPGGACLCLARFVVQVDTTTRLVVAIEDPDNTIPERLALLSTARLQERLAATWAAGGGIGGVGPELGALTFTATGTDEGTLSVDVSLISDGPVPTPLQNDPVSSLTVALHRFTDAGDWVPVGVTPSYVTSPAPSFEIAFASGEATPGRYRVLLESLSDRPVVDLRMRPLSPPRFARHFRLLAGPALAPTLFDT